MAQLRALAPRLPGSAPAVVESPNSTEHTEEEWEAHRGLIEGLYMGEQRKLAATMAVMRSRHGFAATEQMYKKRLRRWNIRKRSYRRSPDGQDTAHAGHDALQAEKVPGRRRSAPGNACMALDRTYRMEPYAGLEVVLDGVCSWSLAKLDSHYAGPDPMSSYLASPNQPPLQDSRTMYRTFELVFDLWYYGKGQLAGMAARRALYALEFVLTQDHPDLVWHILDAVYDMVDRGHMRLLGMFLAHAGVLVRRLLPVKHPLLRILEQLMRCDYTVEPGRQQVCHLLRQAWQHNVHILSQRIALPGPRHLWLYEQLIWDGRTPLRKGSELAQHRAAVTKALAELSQTLGAGTGDGDCAALRIEALRLEYTQMDLGDRQRAQALASGLLARTASATGSARSSARFHAYARKMLARLHQQQHDWAAAEAHLRWAVRKREAAHGTGSDLRVIRDLWVLAAHLQAAGRPDAAGHVARDAVARAERFLCGGDAAAAAASDGPRGN